MGEGNEEEPHEDDEKLQHRPVAVHQVVDEHGGQRQEKPDARHRDEKRGQVVGIGFGHALPAGCYRRGQAE